MEKMDYQEIVHDLINRIKSEYEIQNEIDHETDLRDLLDSLDIMNFIFYVEDKYGMTVNEEDVDAGDFLIVGQAATYILENLKR